MHRATKNQIPRAATLFAAILCLGLPSTAFGFSTSQVTSIPSPPAGGATMTFNFTNIPASATDVSVTVELYGDYNGSSEFADVTIDGTTPAGSTINPTGTQCNVSVTGSSAGNRAVFTVARTLTNDNDLTVVVVNSANVSGSLCDGTANSDRVRVRLSYTSLPDLDVTASTVPVGGGTVTAGQPFDASVTIRNAGDVPVRNNYSYRLLFCPTATPMGCTNLSLEPSGPLFASNQARTVTRTLTLPANTPAGTGYIRTSLDVGNRVAEGREDNNDDYDSITVVAPSRPDLQVSSSAAPVGASLVPAGSPITITFELQNQGLAFTDDFRISFYHCQAADSSACSLGTSITNTDDFDVGQTRTYSQTFSTSSASSYASGTNYVRIRLDTTNVLAEGTTGEANNNDYDAFILTRPTQPDLFVGAAAAPVGTTYAASGQQVTVDYTLTNQGSQFAAPFTVALYHCTSMNPRTCGSRTAQMVVDTFAVGQQRSYTATLTLPNSVTSPSSFVRVFVDDGGVIAEENEANNNRYRSIRVRDPDLRIAALTVTGTAAIVTPGQPISFQYTISNLARGGMVTQDFSVRHYYCEAEDTTACTSISPHVFIVDDFVSGGTHEYTRTYVLPAVATVGTRYIRAFVDSSGNQIAEANEDNNNNYAAITVTCPVGVAGASCDVCDTDYYGFPGCSYCLASTTCNDNGTCDAAGGCACATGFAGAGCEYSDANTCGGQGVAQFDGSCACSAGYAGLACEYSDTETCSDSGVAQDDGSCVCDAGSAGEACQYSDLTTCNGGGAAQDDGSCLCRAGFAGTACQYSDAVTCNGGGTALDDGSCECLPNTAGPACEFSDEVHCSGGGMVQNDGTCRCAQGFAGSACQYSDAETCGDSGAAQVDGTCVCVEGYAGDACQHSDAETCSGQGVAQGDGTCVCASGYVGGACQNSDAETCNGRGAAQADGSCVCEDGAAGHACEFTDGVDCSGQGSAQADGGCVCAEGFEGEACDEVPAQSCRCTRGSGSSPWAAGLALLVVALQIRGRRRRK